MRPGETTAAWDVHGNVDAQPGRGFAVTESNGFAPDLRDYTGRRVVVVARAVTARPGC
jgi:hypothetical protein